MPDVDVGKQQRLRDSAFELARAQRRKPSGPADLRRRLAERFPDLGGENSPVIWGALDQAFALIRRAEEVAELYRQQLVDESTALQRLQAQFPGFSDAIYRAAYADGLFATR